MIYLPVVIFLLDQLAKEWVRREVVHGDFCPVLSWLNISHVHNTGAAWGIFAGSSAILSLISVLAIILLLRFRRHLAGDSRLQAWSLSLMAGGILGNLMDRVKLGYVVDFVDVHWGESHFPSFNVADAAISCGVALYMLGVFLSERRRPAPPVTDLGTGDGGAITPPADSHG